MEVILDTSFILTCIKEKIDFLIARDFGNLILPLQVIDELRQLVEKKKGREKNNAKLALDIIETNRTNFKIFELETKHVDSGILNYVKNKEGKIIIATIDKEMKRKLRGRVRFLVIRAGKKLELV